MRADELEWQALDNGALLHAAELLQQNLTSRKLAIVILSSNQLADFAASCSPIGTAVDFVQTGQIARVVVTTL